MKTSVFLRSPEVPVFWPSYGFVGTEFTLRVCSKRAHGERLVGEDQGGMAKGHGEALAQSHLHWPLGLVSPRARDRNLAPHSEESPLQWMVLKLHRFNGKDLTSAQAVAVGRAKKATSPAKIGQSMENDILHGPLLGCTSRAGPKTAVQ